MRPLAPLTAFLLAALLPALPLPAQETVRAVGKGVKAGSEKPWEADKGQGAVLRPANFEVKKDAVIYLGPPAVTLDKDLLEKADLEINSAGRIAYKRQGGPGEELPVEEKNLVPILTGLLPFARAKAASAADVGAKLREWGVPPQFNGKHLLNPDGTATYYGLMLYQSGAGEKDFFPKVSGERLAASLSLYESAFQQAFDKTAPDVAAKDLERARSMLTGSKPGETPIKRLDASAYTSPADWKDKLSKSKVNSDESMATLGKLARTRYHQDRELGTPPPPSLDETVDKKEPPSQLGLMVLMNTLDKLNGAPLSAAQQEWLVKSFPMGETVWRMKAPELWRAGLTGLGVKVAVIDTGVGFHQDLDTKTVGRVNHMRDRGQAQYGEHATHVAGTILALAPNAELRSYRGIGEGSFKSNPRLALEGDEAMKALMDAVDQAVKDGNTVINMSLGGDGRPTGPLAEKINAYAGQGIVFVIAAGNDGSVGPKGVDQPGNAPRVITVGSVDVNDRYSRFSSFGSVWDPANLTHWVKKIVMAPGQNINSSALPMMADGSVKHQVMSGTSMATPHVAGVVTLLMQQAGVIKDPVARGEAVRGAVLDGGKPMSAKDLPTDAQPDQDFVLVDPIAAHKRLRDGVLVRAVGK